jgi:hypothetical protein
MQTGSGVHPAPYPVGTGSCFLRSRAVGGVRLTAHLQVVLENVDVYFHFPIRLHGVVLN